MKELSMIDAFRALNEIDDEVNEIPLKKRKKVNEAYELNLNGTAEDMNQAKQQLNKIEEDSGIKIIDADADTVDHLKKGTDYVGQMILQCKVCKALKFTDADKLVADPDNDEIVNLEDECPNCHSSGKGFTVIGQVGKSESQKPEQEQTDEQPKEENGAEENESEELPTLDNDTKSEENGEPTFDNDVQAEEQPAEQESEEEASEEPEETEEEAEEKPKKEKVDKNTQAFDDTPEADDTEDLELPKLGDEVDEDDVAEDDTEKKNESLEEVEASSWKVCKVCNGQKEVVQDNIKDQASAEVLIAALKQCNPGCDYLACRGDENIQDAAYTEVKSINEQEQAEEVVPTVEKVLGLVKNENDVKKFKVYTNEEEPKLIFNGPVSEMTPSIKNAEVELFNIPAMIVNVVEGKVEGKKLLKDILDCYTNEDEKYISIDNDLDEDEIFVGSKAEILENGLGEKYSVVSIEVPTFMEVAVKATDNQPDALPDADREQVQPEEDIVECNMSESYASLDEFKLNNQLKEYSYNYVDSNNENQTYNVLAESLEEAAEKIQTRFNGGTNSYNEILFGNNTLKQYINVDVKDIKESVKSESKRNLNESLNDNEDHDINEDLDNYNEDDSLNMIDEHDEYIQEVVNEWCPEICKETKDVEEILDNLESLCFDNDEYFNRDKFRPFVIEFIEVNENLDINGEITEEVKDNTQEENNEEIPTDNVPKAEVIDIVSDVADEIKDGIEADKDQEKTIDEIVDAKIDELFPGKDEEEIEIEDDVEAEPVEEALDEKGMVHVPSIEELAQKLGEDVKVEDDGEVIEIVNDDPEIVPEDKGIEVVDEAVKELPENLIIKLSDLDTEDLEGVKNYLEDKFNTVVENADDLYIEESNDGKSILVDGIIWGKKLEEDLETIEIIDDEKQPETPAEQIVEDNEVVCKAEKVMAAYQNANKWLDSVKEAVYQGMNCPFFSSYIHSLAHTMPGRFDKFGDILHTVNIEIPYPTTEELEKKPENITQAFETIFKCLDDIKETLNDFIKCTDEKKHGMACAAETLLNDIESEYPTLYRLKGMWENAKDDVLGFDKFVMQYVEHKKDLLESIRKERDRKLSESCKKKKQLKESFTEVGSLRYKHTEDLEEDDSPVIEDEAYITRENGSYQVSWGGGDDYYEESSIQDCKDEVESYYSDDPNFEWIDTELEDVLDGDDLEQLIYEESERLTSEFDNAEDAVDDLIDEASQSNITFDRNEALEILEKYFNSEDEEEFEESIKHCKNRKELSEAINQCKNNNKPYKISRSITEGFRYDVILVKPEEEKEEEIKSSSELPVDEPVEECPICKCNPCKCHDEVKPNICPECGCDPCECEDVEIEGVDKEELKELVKEILSEITTSNLKEEVGDEEYFEPAGSKLSIPNQVETKTYSPEEQQLMERMMEVGENTAQAIKDTYDIDVDPRLVVADIVRDLRLIKGDINPDQFPEGPAGDATREMFHNYTAFTNFVDELVQAFGGQALDLTPVGRLKIAFRQLNSPSFDREAIYQAIDSDAFRLAAQNGQVPMIAANDPKLLETVMNEDVGDYTIAINGGSDILTDDDGNTIKFNSAEAAQAYIDQQDLEDAEVTRQHGKADDMVESVDPETDIEIPESVEEFDDESFDDEINEYFNENYNNAVVYKTNSGCIDKSGNIVLEGFIKGLKEDKTLERPIKFLLQPNKKVDENLEKGSSYIVTNNVSDEKFEFSK